jgi:apolipoprotein N-acyltransferase
MPVSGPEGPARNGALSLFSGDTRRERRGAEFLLCLAAAAVSGALLVAAFPGTGWAFLAWVALVPLFLALRGRSPGSAVMLCVVASSVFIGGMIRWGMAVEGASLLKFGLLVLCNAWPLAGFGWLAAHIARRRPGAVALVLPSAWVAFEYLKTHAGWLSFPFGLLGYSQYQVLPVARLAAFTGVYGVSFLIVACNASLAELIRTAAVPERSVGLLENPVSARGGKTGRAVPLAILAAIAALVGGSFATAAWSEAATGRLAGFRAAMIQGNIYADEKEDGSFRNLRKTYAVYERLTREAAAGKPAIILWPSSAVPGRIPYDFKLVEDLAVLSRDSGVYLLVGTAGMDKFRGERQKVRRMANSAFLFSPGGEILGKYDKINLLPFDEYLPMRSRFSWPSWIIRPGMQDMVPGNRLTVFEAGPVRFGVQICWENMFPEQFRDLAGRGIDFMCGMTNEDFAKSPVGHRQMLTYYVFRALENHIAIARTSPTGITCLIGPDGRILGHLRDPEGRDVNIAGVLFGDIPLTRERTFYTRAGDIFIYAIAGMLLVFLAIPARRPPEQ